MEPSEWVCIAAVLIAGGLCYMAGWTGRAIWSAGAVGVTVLQMILSRSFACTAAMVVVSVLCAMAGHFDRRR